ncbi:hypothetical protein PTKIN_Ptkin12aG0051500 [Pterospermum kingtungense]
MNHHHHRFPSSPFFPLSIIFLLQVTLEIPLSLGNTSDYEACRDAQFECGNITAGYPFSGNGIPSFCGHPDLQLDCEYATNSTTINIGDVRYEVLDILPDGQTLKIARQDLIKTDSCYPEFQNSDLDFGLFELVYASAYANVTLLYGCKNFTQTSLGHLNCTGNGDRYKDVWLVSEVNGSVPCSSSVTVPILRSSWAGTLNYSLLIGVLKEGFEVKWKADSQLCQICKETGGACGFNVENRTTCYCPNPTPGEATKECRVLYSTGDPTPARGVTVVVTICLTLLSFIRDKLSNENSIHRKKNDKASVEAFIRNFGSFAPKRYCYADIKKMTNKFKDKLGQGGYGSVYKGTLADGQLVAVKVLSESKGHGEDFMNEVASIVRTSHVNIVTLLGFCYDRSKRALIYEFMRHGSLDKYIYNQGSKDQSRQLEWKTLYDIALGIARGLEYLHQGCNTRILHFDIKPHNILLDENFCPKISDFGLSKLCERKESVISMTGARGTVGYIAPEVFCRNFGGVSHKSDVYSYGMMVLEMVGGRKNIDAEVSKTSEIYFPSWIYKHLDQGMNLSVDGVIAEEEEEITRKLIVVSLWCIQTNPIDRPSMTKVLEMLKGSVQSLVVPPRPFLSSPVRSPRAASTT